MFLELKSLGLDMRITACIMFLSLLPSTQASAIFARQAPTCGGIANLKQCGNGFPSSFCCPTGSTCLSLNSPSVQSVICCPSGSDCAFIQTITCDASQLDATLHPDNQMHLSDTKNVQLPTCGDRCCPLGYSCTGGMCSKDSKPPSSSTTPTAASTPSATNPASASQTKDCPLAAEGNKDRPFDGRAFAAGFFPGIVIGALGTIGLIWLIRRRYEAKERKQYSGDFGHVARQISDPIYDPQQAARTDFIRRGSRSAQASPNSIYKSSSEPRAGGLGLTPRIKSMWDRTPKLNFGFTPGPPASSTQPPAVRAGDNPDPYTTPPPIHARVNGTNPLKAASRALRNSGRPPPGRSGSQETIDVLMPAPSFLEPPKAPGMRENRYTTDSTNTTFTKLMERAGFDERGQQEVRDWTTPGKGKQPVL